MRSKPFVIRVYRLLGIAGLVALISQNVIGQKDRMVLLNIRVTDKFRQAVPKISKEKFQVTEDGVQQKIELFTTEQAPVSYGLVIDNSGSMRTQFDGVILTGIQIVNSNTHEDQAFIIRFVDSDRMEVVQECTSDKKLLIDSLQSMYVEAGQTALIDAVYLGAEKLAKLKIASDKPQRKALVVVTDGEDRMSYYTTDQLFNLLAGTDIQVFVIGLTSELELKKRDRPINLITRLAMETGGRAFFPKSRVELELIGEAIINDIRTQYTIGYVPSANTSNDFHKVQVSITGLPSEESYIAITRLGYSNTASQ